MRSPLPARLLEGRRVAVLVTPGAAWVEAFLGVLLGLVTALPRNPLGKVVKPELILALCASKPHAT